MTYHVRNQLLFQLIKPVIINSTSKNNHYYSIVAIIEVYSMLVNNLFRIQMFTRLTDIDVECPLLFSSLSIQVPLCP